MVVSVAVFEIFSIKEWCDLENRVRARSRSLEMAKFNRWSLENTNINVKKTVVL